MLRNVVLGMGLIQLLKRSALIIGWTWDDAGLQAWARPCLPELHTVAGPIQHFQNALLDAWGAKVAKDLCQREGLRNGLYLIFLHL